MVIVSRSSARSPAARLPSAADHGDDDAARLPGRSAAAVTGNGEPAKPKARRAGWVDWSKGRARVVAREPAGRKGTKELNAHEQIVQVIRV